MTNTAILTGLYEIRNYLDQDERKAYDYAMREEDIRNSKYAMGMGISLARLIYKIETEMKEKEFKNTGGKTKVVSAVKRILKNVPESQVALKGVLKCDGYSIVCDSYHAVRFWHDIPVEESKNPLGYPKSINDLVDGAMQTADGPNIAPTLAEVKSVIEMEKARRKAAGVKTNRYNPIQYKLNKNTWVNAEYLRDMMEAIGECAIHTKETDAACNRSMVYFVGEDADGILCPINHN